MSFSLLKSTSCFKFATNAADSSFDYRLRPSPPEEPLLLAVEFMAELMPGDGEVTSLFATVSCFEPFYLLLFDLLDLLLPEERTGDFLSLKLILLGLLGLPPSSSSSFYS